jgi:hypothetical protein
MRFGVGRREVSGLCATDVANHPQSLWISLWTAFRHPPQVAYRIGFFFVRSNFERSVFVMAHQSLTSLSPLEGFSLRPNRLYHVLLAQGSG